jgi:CheY-like chemotaxis protein
MRVVKILLVEDDQLDVMDLKRTLEKLKIIYTLTVAKNGEEAVKILKEKEESSIQNLPDFVLIDINMPRMNGLEFLSVVRNTPQWKHLKCFIITTSEEKVDKEEAKKLGIAGYIVKPLRNNQNYSGEAYNLILELMNLKD